MNGSARPGFLIHSQDFAPAYLRLHRTGELERRAARAVAGLAECRSCPRACAADRLHGETGECETGRHARVASYGPHHGEEDCLRGTRGSGTVFFAQCSLHCVFCQNFDISHATCGQAIGAAELARILLELQAAGCHNINLVTPTHVVPQILEALPLAVAGGLWLPLVYNTSGYDALESLRLLDGVVDVYMPDFKFWDGQAARRYLDAADYPEVARRALREMHRQVGALKLDEAGLARRGVLLRRLLMPGGTADTREIMRFLAREVSPHTWVNLLAQYHPAGRVGPDAFAELDRPITQQEYADAHAAAREAGIHRFDGRAGAAF